MWSGNDIRRQTKTSQEVIHNPHFCVLGSGTTDRVLSYIKKNGADNGLYERILYAYPPKDWVRRQGQPEDGATVAEWNGRIRNLMETCQMLQSRLALTADQYCVHIVQKFQDELNNAADKAVANNQTTLANIYPKIYTYFLRLCGVSTLIFETFSDDNSNIFYLTERALRMATALTRYYMGTLEYTHNLIFDVEDSNTLDATGLSEYRKNLLKNILEMYPDLPVNTIISVINKLTPGPKPLTSTTAYRWINSLKKPKK